MDPGKTLDLEGSVNQTLRRKSLSNRKVHHSRASGRSPITSSQNGSEITLCPGTILKFKSLNKGKRHLYLLSVIFITCRSASCYEMTATNNINGFSDKQSNKPKWVRQRGECVVWSGILAENKLWSPKLDAEIPRLTRAAGYSLELCCRNTDQELILVKLDELPDTVLPSWSGYTPSCSVYLHLFS